MWNAFLCFYFFAYSYGTKSMHSNSLQFKINLGSSGAGPESCCGAGAGTKEGRGGVRWLGGRGGSPIAEWPLLLEGSNDKTLKVKEGTQRPGRESPLQRQAACSEAGIRMKTFTSVRTEMTQKAESSTSAEVKDGRGRSAPETSCTLWDLMCIPPHTKTWGEFLRQSTNMLLLYFCRLFWHLYSVVYFFLKLPAFVHKHQYFSLLNSTLLLRRRIWKWMIF